MSGDVEPETVLDFGSEEWTSEFCISLSEFRNDGVKGAGEGDKKHRSMHTPYNIILLANRTA